MSNNPIIGNSTKLYKIIEACKVDGRDLYRAVAAGYFEIPYDEVTAEQRAYARDVVVLGIMYSRSDKSIAEQLAHLQEDN